MLGPLLLPCTPSFSRQPGYSGSASPDGMLVGTAPEIADAVNDTLRHFNLPEVVQQQVNDWIGHGTRELLIQALATDAAAVRASGRLALIAADFDKRYQLALRY
jgi:phosphoglycolate phosphatase